MQKKLYFLGIGGTLMGNLALLAREAGYQVSGSDGKMYPPMSDLLRESKIQTFEGFHHSQIEADLDCVVIGNANLPRGNDALEFVLNSNIPYYSGPEWLANQILRERHVMAVAGTHGKTTTSGILTWILTCAHKQPGYLIGGIPLDSGSAASLGASPYFVIEADEYDTSYFDRRAKFMHYRPRTLIFSNLEYDHADIYDSLEAIQYQFQHLIRTVPGNGRVIVPWGDTEIENVLKKGIWTPISRWLVNPSTEQLSSAKQSSDDLWLARTSSPSASEFTVSQNGEEIGTVTWQQIGEHNVKNALAAIIAANEVGVKPQDSLQAIKSFKGMKRRLEVIAKNDRLTFYDDFAHHPTAIQSTLTGLRGKIGTDKLIAVIEPRSHTMQLGTHLAELQSCCKGADEVIWFDGPNVEMDLQALIENSPVPSHIYRDVDELVSVLCADQSQPTHVLLMSNGAFAGIYEKLKQKVS